MTDPHILDGGIVLQTAPDSVQPLIEGFLSAIPSIIAAIVILIIGWIVGIVLGNAVKRIIRSVSPSQYVSGTPLEPEGDADESLAGGLGKLVKYIIIIFALLLALQQLQLPIPGDILSSIVSAVLKIVVAAIILGVGFAIGRFVGDIIGSVLGGFHLDRYLEGTPLARITDAVGGVGNALGTVVEYVIYYFALVQAVDALQFGVLTQMFTGLTAYLPVLIGALVFLLVGIYVADLLGDAVAGINTNQMTDYAGLGVKVFAYYYVITTVLSRLGLDVDILETLFNTVVVSVFGALSIGIALAIAIGLGWGSKDYIAENIGDWMSSARGSAEALVKEDETASSTDDTGDMFDDGGSGPSGTGGSDD